MFPEVTTWITNLTTLIRLVGAGLVTVSILLGAALISLSLGSERRVILGRVAIFNALAGAFIFAAAPKIQDIITAFVGK